LFHLTGVVEYLNEQRKQKSCSEREDPRIDKLKKEPSNERTNKRIKGKSELRDEWKNGRTDEPRGVPPEKLGGGVRPASQNPTYL